MKSSKIGVLLAGGEGTRLHNQLYNKHLALVGDQLMIEYPLRTLGAMGCTQAVVVGSPRSTPDLVRLIGDGSNYNLDVSYKVQAFPNGAPEALAMAEDLTYGTFPVLCGDVYLDPAPPVVDEPTLFHHQSSHAHNHSVWSPETNEITEKPARAIGQRAIIAYAFDERVYDVINQLEPSGDELQMADIYRAYLAMAVKMQPYDGYFKDMGTPDGLLSVAVRERRNHRE